MLPSMLLLVPVYFLEAGGPDSTHRLLHPSAYSRKRTLFHRALDREARSTRSKTHPRDAVHPSRLQGLGWTAASAAPRGARLTTAPSTIHTVLQLRNVFAA